MRQILIASAGIVGATLTEGTLLLSGGATPSLAAKPPNYFMRDRSGAREPQEADLAVSHLGFRTVLRAPDPART